MEDNVAVITPCLILNNFSDGAISWQYILVVFNLKGKTICFLILTFVLAPDKRIGGLMVFCSSPTNFCKGRHHCYVFIHQKSVHICSINRILQYLVKVASLFAQKDAHKTKWISHYIPIRPKIETFEFMEQTDTVSLKTKGHNTILKEYSLNVDS